VDAPETDSAERGVTADEVERLRRALDEAQGRHLRLRADFDNLRRRLASEQEAARQEARRVALGPLLDVLDALERALKAGSTDRDFYEGVAATHRLFINALREAGAEPMETVGRPFDPNVHEAVTTQPAGSPEQDHKVGQVLQAGYRLGETLLRPARVIVLTWQGV